MSSIRVAGTPENAGIVGEAQFAVMKPGVSLVSAFACGIVDETAWARAIEAGVVAGSAVVAGPMEDAGGRSTPDARERDPRRSRRRRRSTRRRAPQRASPSR